MKRILLTVTVIGLALLTASEAFAAGGRCRRGYAAPAAPVTTAQAAGGYRTYSYEPGMAPAATYRAPARVGARPSFLDAASKALGKSYN